MTLVLALLLASVPEPNYWDRLKDFLNRNLGRPYVWGAAGIKSYDCSGFVWRMLHDNGVLIKRTTARKLFVSLPAIASPDQETQFGNLVFFDDLKHVGIVNDALSFYHAQSSRGTNLSQFDPFWRRLIVGYRRVPSPANAPGLPKPSASSPLP